MATKPTSTRYSFTGQPMLKAATSLDERTRRRWEPLAELPGFIAVRHDLEFLNAGGVRTGVVNGIGVVHAEDKTKAVQLLATRFLPK